VFFRIPLVDEFRTVDLRLVTHTVPPQEMVTKDSVTVHVDAVIFARVNDAIKATVMVNDYVRATSLLGQTTLRSVIGECELDELLQKRDVVNQKIKRILDRATEDWGVHVTAVEVKDVKLPLAMQRSMASQAEAERERRAKVISADGEYQASRTLLNAATEMTRNPATMQLRYLQTLREIATERTNTIIFPLPMDLLSAFLRGQVTAASSAAHLPLSAAASASLRAGAPLPDLVNVNVDGDKMLH